MTDYWQGWRHADHQRELCETAYHHLLENGGSRPWIHFGSEDSDLSVGGRHSANFLNIEWTMGDEFAKIKDDSKGANVFIDGNSLALESFGRLLDRFACRADEGTVCGTGFFRSDDYRAALIERFEGRISIVQSSVWQLQRTMPPIPGSFRGAVCLPCYQDTQVLEENFAHHPEHLSALEMHVFDDNFEAAESQRVTALARECGWHYHRSGLGKHPNWTNNYADYSQYNRFIWQSLTSLADDYDFVIKLDTDTCILAPDWHHEFAARLCGRAAIMGTIEVRPLYQVASFWNAAWPEGYWREIPVFPASVQGGLYGVSREALQRLRKMGFLPGPHKTCTEDGYVSYAAQLLEVELLPAATVGSWSKLALPPLNSVRHLKAIHPLLRGDRIGQLETAQKEPSIR